MLRRPCLSAAPAGAILTGVFAINEYGGTPGLIEGNAIQVWERSVEGIVIVIVYDVIVSLVLLKIIDMVIGLGSPRTTSKKVSISPSMARPCSDARPIWRFLVMVVC